MQGDILPPRQKKADKTKKQQEKTSAFIKSAVTTKGLEDDPKIEAIKPLTLPPATESTKRVSFGNIRSNLRPKHWYNLSREEQWVLFSGLTAIFLCLVLCLFVLFRGNSYVPPEKIPTKKYVPPKPVTVDAPLTGIAIDPALAKRPVTGIMIENSLDARPQSGLQDAGVVYEAIAEGGITRFIAIFQDTRPQYIGPVRSLRPYYIDFATPWDASIAHVGGSPEALSEIRAGGKDLDQFFNSGSYWRQNTRDAPHNVYTSFDKLDALNTVKGYTSSTTHSWSHKADTKLPVPVAKSVDLGISSALYNAHYDYDTASNSYLRSEGGKPHMVASSPDDNAVVQLKPKVVVAIVTSYGIQSDGKHSDYGVTGSGTVYIFQDGGLTTGTWSKADRSSQYSFKDVGGKDIKLNRGQVWLTMLSGTNQVHYTP
jgi:hypothetical protein